jgi:putative Mg2+ transporter-C (MgtC) family protein
VRGLTTAAIVWITAAVGMACGAGLPILALAVTTAHFVVVFVYPCLSAALPWSRHVNLAVRVVYEDGRGILRDILAESTRLGFVISGVATQQLGQEVHSLAAIAVTVEVHGQPSLQPLTLALTDVDGVLEVASTDPSPCLTKRAS